MSRNTTTNRRIAALELSNATLARENRRLVRLIQLRTDAQNIAKIERDNRALRSENKRLLRGMENIKAVAEQAAPTKK